MTSTTGSAGDGVGYRSVHGERIEELLATSFSSLYLALGAHHVYVATSSEGTVTRVPKRGGVPLVLAVGHPHMHALALHRGTLYWTVSRGPGRGVWAMRADGGVPCTLAIGAALDLAVDGESLAWTEIGFDENDEENDAPGSVHRLSLDGRDERLVAADQSYPWSVTMHDDSIYWVCTGHDDLALAGNGSVWASHRSGAPIELASSRVAPRSVVTDAAEVYWTEPANRIGPRSDGGIFACATTGGPIRRLCADVGEPATEPYDEDTGLLAVDHEHVYWLSRTRGVMWRVPKQGGAPEAMLEPRERVLGSTALVVDETHVYWTSPYARRSGAGAMRMSKRPRT